MHYKNRDTEGTCVDWYIVYVDGIINMLWIGKLITIINLVKLKLVVLHISDAQLFFSEAVVVVSFNV